MGLSHWINSWREDTSPFPINDNKGVNLRRGSEEIKEHKAKEETQENFQKEKNAYKNIGKTEVKKTEYKKEVEQISELIKEETNKAS